MTDKQENKLSMYLALRTVLDNNNAAWVALVAYGNAVTAFKAKIDSIQAARQVQEGATTGVTIDKTEAKMAAIAVGLEIQAAVFAFASVTNNNTLKEQMSYAPNELEYVRDTILYDRLMLIHGKADDNVASLGDYGVDATDISDYKDLIDVYNSLIQSPRVAIGNRKMATDFLPVGFAGADAVLKGQLDPLTETLKSSQTVFYNQYWNARTIVDLHGGGGGDEEPTPPTP